MKPSNRAKAPVAEGAAAPKPASSRRARTLVTLTDRQRERLQAQADKLEIPLSRLCAEILKAVLREELKRADGRGYFYGR